MHTTTRFLSKLTDEVNTRSSMTLCCSSTWSRLGVRTSLMRGTGVWPYQPRDFVHLPAGRLSSGGVCDVARCVTFHSNATGSLRATLTLGVHISPLDEATEDSEQMCPRDRAPHWLGAIAPSERPRIAPRMRDDDPKTIEDHAPSPVQKHGPSARVEGSDLCWGALFGEKSASSLRTRGEKHTHRA